MEALKAATLLLQHTPYHNMQKDAAQALLQALAVCWNRTVMEERESKVLHQLFTVPVGSSCLAGWYPVLHSRILGPLISPFLNASDSSVESCFL
jgi:hypothetical protein